MDMMAAFGGLIVTEGATAPGLVAIQRFAPDAQVRATWTAEQQQAIDQVFAKDTSDPTQSPAYALLVTTVCASTLKGIVLDEPGHLEEDAATADDESEEEDDRDSPRV